MASPSHHSTAPLLPSSSFSDWLRLLRVPNLLTVPGDPVAGYLLAAGAAAAPDARLGWVAASGLCFYAGGLVMNDWSDREVDRRERPDRPIASGRIAPGRAQAVFSACFLAGLAASAAAGRGPLVVALLLLAAITAYNLLHRAGPPAVALMGACRGFSVMLGVSVAGTGSVAAWAGVLLIAGFVLALTALARREMEHVRPGWRAWMPATVVLAGFAAFERLTHLPGEMEMRMAGAFFFAFALAGLAAWRLNEGGPRMAPGAVGLMISALIPMQSALCIAADAGVWGLAAAFLAIAAWPINRLLARIASPS